MENTDVIGASANFADVRNIDVAQGRFITPADDEHRSEVVFIGADLASKFFPNVDPIGKTIRAETHSYQVIGVAEPFGDRKSTRLNSSHTVISYAVFCLKKKKKKGSH